MPPDYRMSPGPSNSATLGFYAQAEENEQEEEDEESYSDIEMDDRKEILNPGDARKDPLNDSIVGERTFYQKYLEPIVRIRLLIFTLNVQYLEIIL